MKKGSHHTPETKAKIGVKSRAYQEMKRRETAVYQKRKRIAAEFAKIARRRKGK